MANSKLKGLQRIKVLACFSQLALPVQFFPVKTLLVFFLSTSSLPGKTRGILGRGEDGESSRAANSPPLPQLHTQESSWTVIRDFPTKGMQAVPWAAYTCYLQCWILVAKIPSVLGQVFPAEHISLTVQAPWPASLRPTFTALSIILSSFRHSAFFSRCFNSMEIGREICLHTQDPPISLKPFQFYCLLLIIESFASYLWFARILVQPQGPNDAPGLGMEMNISLSWLKVLPVATNAHHSPDIHVHVTRHSQLPAQSMQVPAFMSTELHVAVTETSKVSLKKWTGSLKAKWQLQAEHSGWLSPMLL